MTHFPKRPAHLLNGNELRERSFYSLTMERKSGLIVAKVPGFDGPQRRPEIIERIEPGKLFWLINFKRFTCMGRNHLNGFVSYRDVFGYIPLVGLNLYFVEVQKEND